MGIVLSFQPRKPAQKRRPAATSATPSVVLFPGVRYERLPNGDAAGLTRRLGELMPRLPAPQRP